MKIEYSLSGHLADDDFHALNDENHAPEVDFTHKYDLQGHPEELFNHIYH